VLRKAPAGAGHAVKEYLAHLDDATVGATTTVTPKLTSPFRLTSRLAPCAVAFSLPMPTLFAGSILSISGLQ
jgi:hypothetical protein